MKLLIILTIVATAVVASAQTPTAPSAEDLYAQGQAAYDRADWPTAVSKWKASFQLSGENDLLFNIAQAERQAGDCPSALANYRRYVGADADPTSDQHKIANDWVRDLETLCSPPPPMGVQPKLAPELTGHKDRALPGRTLKISGIAISGGGIAILATGLFYGHRAQTIADQVTNACHTSCDWAAWQDKDAGGRSDATIGRVLDGIGVATIVGGSVLYYLGVRQGTVTVEPHTREGGAVLSWSGSW
jgi:hypothetical protein